MNKTEENELKILGEEKFMENWKETTIDGHSFWSNKSHKLTAIEDPDNPELVYVLHEEIPICVDPRLSDFLKKLGEENGEGNEK